MVIVLKSGFLVLDKGIFKKDLVISDGKIQEISDNYPGNGKFFDISGKYVLPGLIDVHVHFREPGQEYKEDFLSGSRAAVMGGVTTVFDMPNNVPPIVTMERLEAKRRLIEGNSYCNYALYMGVSTEKIDEIEIVKNVPGIKVYLGKSTGDMCLNDQASLEKVFRSGKLIVLHAEDEKLMADNAKRFIDVDETKKHGLIRSPEAAYQAVCQALDLAQCCNTRLHIAHVSTALEIAEIRKWKTTNISFEVAPHHLFLTEKDYSAFGNHFLKVNPPLRSAEDQEALWKALDEGLVDMIATDHAAHLPEEKKRSYEEAPSGIPGVELMLPLLLNAVHEHKLSLGHLVKLTAENPARLYKIPNKGKIEAGYDADLVICDLNLTKIVSKAEIHSKCGWSPYEGWQLTGWPIMTVVGGEIVMRDGVIERQAFGKEIRW